MSNAAKAVNKSEVLEPNKAVTSKQTSSKKKVGYTKRSKLGKVSAKAARVSSTAPIDYNDLAPGVRVANGLQ